MDTRSIVWTDANGLSAITMVRSTAGAGAIQAALLAASQADYIQWWESATTINGAPAPAGGQYRGGNQRAAFTFICADNSQVDLILPAPSVGIFLADQVTVDITNATVSALVAACVGSLTSATGSAATALLGATLSPGSRSPL